MGDMTRGVPGTGRCAAAEAIRLCQRVEMGGKVWGKAEADADRRVCRRRSDIVERRSISTGASISTA